MGIYEYTCVWVGDACERERKREKERERESTWVLEEEMNKGKLFSLITFLRNI